MTTKNVEIINPSTGKPVKGKVKMATKKNAKYTEAWVEVKIKVQDRDIIYGAKAKMIASDDLKEVQDGIFTDCLVNIQAMLSTLQT